MNRKNIGLVVLLMTSASCVIAMKPAAKPSSPQGSPKSVARPATPQTANQKYASQSKQAIAVREQRAANPAINNQNQVSIGDAMSSAVNLSNQSIRLNNLATRVGEFTPAQKTWVQTKATLSDLATRAKNPAKATSQARSTSPTSVIRSASPMQQDTPSVAEKRLAAKRIIGNQLGTKPATLEFKSDNMQKYIKKTADIKEKNAYGPQQKQLLGADSTAKLIKINKNKSTESPDLDYKSIPEFVIEQKPTTTEKFLNLFKSKERIAKDAKKTYAPLEQEFNAMVDENQGEPAKPTVSRFAAIQQSAKNTMNRLSEYISRKTSGSHVKQTASESNLTFDINPRLVRPEETDYIPKSISTDPKDVLNYASPAAQELGKKFNLSAAEQVKITRYHIDLAQMENYLSQLQAKQQKKSRFLPSFFYRTH